MRYLVTTKQISFDDCNNISISQSIEMLSKLQEISADTETTGLNCHIDELICLTLGNNEFQILIDVESIDIQHYKQILETKILVFQNAKFDLKFLFKHDIMPTKVFDTFLAEKVLTQGLSHEEAEYNLEYLVHKYCNKKLNKSLQKQINKYKWTQAFIDYSMEDIVYLSIIKDKQMSVINREDLNNALVLENMYVIPLAYNEYKGAPLNVNQWFQLAEENQKELDKIEFEIIEMLSKDYKLRKYATTQLDLFTNKPALSINLNSSDQMIKVFKSLGIHIFNKEDNETIDKKELKKFKDHHPLVSLYLNYKEYHIRVKTFGNSFIEKYYLPETNRLHTEYSQLVSTARLSSRRPNLQNVPSSKEFRSCFNPGDDYVLLCADYSSQESRILADFANETNFIEFYTKPNRFNGDSHSFVASLLFDYLKDTDAKVIKNDYSFERGLAKTAMFALAYGGVGTTIAKNANISEDKGEEVYNQILQAFPGLANYFDTIKKKVLKDGYMVYNNFTKRKCYLPNFSKYRALQQDINFKKASGIPIESSIWKDLFELKGSYERYALNYIIQGSAADMLKLALVKFFKWTLDNKLHNDVFCVLQVHDEIVLQCKKDDNLIKEASRVLKESMESAALVICKKVPIPADVSQSPFWIK